MNTQSAAKVESIGVSDLAAPKPSAQNDAFSLRPRGQPGLDTVLAGKMARTNCHEDGAGLLEPVGDPLSPAGIPVGDQHPVGHRRKYRIGPPALMPV